MKKTKRNDFSLLAQPDATTQQPPVSATTTTTTTTTTSTRKKRTTRVTVSQQQQQQQQQQQASQYDTPLCKEQWNVDDYIIRGLIYKPVDAPHENVTSTIGFNFTKSQFKDGATQWSHLRKPYRAFFYKIVNLAGYSIGNKKVENIAPAVSQQKKRTKVQQLQQQLQKKVAQKQIEEMDASLKLWYGKLRKSKQLVIDIETLFDAQKKTQVSGYRLWILSKLRRPTSVVTQLSPALPQHSLSESNNEFSSSGGDDDGDAATDNEFHSLQMHASSIDTNMPIDVLSTAFKDSFAECQAIRTKYTEDRAKRITTLLKRKKSKQQTEDEMVKDKAFNLDPTYCYTRCGSNPRECFNIMLRKVLTLDRSRQIVDLNDPPSSASSSSSNSSRKTTRRSMLDELQDAFERDTASGGGGGGARIVNEEDPFPEFKDSRELMKDTYTHDMMDADPASATSAQERAFLLAQRQKQAVFDSSIIRQTFTKEAAMFYWVRTDNILEDQRNINTYLNPTQRLFGDVVGIRDVKQLTQLSMDCTFYTYYNPRTTYRLSNEHCQPEFLSKMPLPHRMGTCLQTTNIQPFVDAAVQRYNRHHSQQQPRRRSGLNIMTGDDDEKEEEGEEGEEGDMDMDNMNAPDSPPLICDQDYLDNEDLDGTMQQRLVDNPVYYGYNAVVQKPLGIHNTRFELTRKDILRCKDQESLRMIKTLGDDDLTEEVKRKFMAVRESNLANKLIQTALRPPLRKVNLLACDSPTYKAQLAQQAVNHGTPAHLTAVAAAAAGRNEEDELLDDSEHTLTGVYSASTLNYIVHDTADIMRRQSEGKTGGGATVTDDDEEESTYVQDEEDGSNNHMVIDEQMSEEARLAAIAAYYQENPDFHGEPHEALKAAAAAAAKNGKEARFKCVVNKNLEDRIPFLKETNNAKISIEWETTLAEANYDVCASQLEKWRPRGTSMEDMMEDGDPPTIEEWQLKRDVELRTCVQNGKAKRNISREYYADAATHTIAPEKYPEYRRVLDRQTGARTCEVWHNFFTSPDVSFANEGVRSDWNKMTTITNGHKKIAHSHQPRLTQLEVRCYHQFKIWCYNLFSIIIMIHYNFKLMYNNYIFKFHHVRWYLDCNNPKNNAINHGDNMGGKSFMLKGVKKTCPSRTGDMITNITANAMNVDRNFNDMLIIIEEMPGHYLGVNSGASKGGSGGGSAAPDSSALEFFKNRLTSGVSMVLYYFMDEENNRRDCKEAHSSCQGSYLCATNAKLADADKHLLSRFILLSVPKNFGDSNSDNGNPMERIVYQFGKDPRHADVVYEQHRDVHRCYMFVEKCVKSGVLDDDVFGVSVDAASIYINQILDGLQGEFKIPTKHDRKRNAVLEMARSMCIAFACWNVLTSPVLQYLQYHPKTGVYLGINVRMFVRGVFPFLHITKDMVIDALTSLSTIWQHDQLKNVLAAAIKSTLLTNTPNAKYRQVTPAESDNVVVEYDDENNVMTNHYISAKAAAAKRGARKSSGSGSSSKRAKPKSSRHQKDMDDAASGDEADDNFDHPHHPSKRPPHQQQQQQQQKQGGMPPMPPHVPVVAGTRSNGMPYFQVQTEPDYNYVSMVDQRLDVIYRGIARQLGDLQVSTNTVEQILRELADELSDTALPSYKLELDVAPNDPAYGTLVLNTNDNLPLIKRKVVIFDYCPKTKRPRISFLISYLKEQMPAMLPDTKIQDLRRFQKHHNRLLNGEYFGDEDDEEEEEAEEGEATERQQHEEEKKAKHSDRKTKRKSVGTSDDDESVSEEATSEASSSEDEDEEDESESEEEESGDRIFKKSLTGSKRSTLTDLFDGDKQHHTKKTKKSKKPVTTTKKQSKASETQSVAAAAAAAAEEVIDEKDTLTQLIDLLKRSALYHEKSETPIIKMIKKKYENSVYGVTNIESGKQRAIDDQYRTIYSGIIPYDQYATAEAADPIKHHDAFPYMPHHIRVRKEFSREISFHDTMKTLVLQRNAKKPLIIPNYAYLPPSALASLSVYDETIKENDVIKATQDLYNHTSSWIQREDVDYTSAKSHLARLGYEPVDVDDYRFLCPCFHDFLYQIHTDYSRIRIEKRRSSNRKDREERKVKYAFNALEMRKIEREEEEDLMRSVMCEYPLCDMFSRVNVVGDIIKAILYGVDNTNSTFLDEMLMANCSAMNDYFTPEAERHNNSNSNKQHQKNANVIRARKRLEYQSHGEQEEARKNLNAVYQKRLVIGAAEAAAQAAKRSNKRALEMSRKATALQKKATAKSSNLSKLDELERGMMATKPLKLTSHQKQVLYNTSTMSH